MRLPTFRYVHASSVDEVVRQLADAPGSTMLLAGGTDLLPNMKRRQQTPSTVVGLRGVGALRVFERNGHLRLGAGLTLAQIVRREEVRRHATALWQAAAQVATPPLRTMGTLGGNLCLDTRCNYYDQTEEWRRAIDYCMKKDGSICWVATSSPRCLAVSSTDTAPALIALGAEVTLVSVRGSRTLRLDDLYVNDGIHYLTRQPDELLTEVRVPDAGWRSTYWKLRRRGSFDFPVLGVAAAARVGDDGRVADARLVLGAVASRPLVVPGVADALRGRPLDDGAIRDVVERAYPLAKPMDNTDFGLVWRKRMTRLFVELAFRELRGDDMREVRRRYAWMSLEDPLG